MAETQGEGRPSPGAGPALPVRLLVWLAMLNAVVLYGVVAFLVARPEAGAPGVPIGLFPALGALLGAAALLSPRFLPEPDPERDSQGAARRPAGIRTKEFVIWALDESVAVVGLVAALVLGNPRMAIPYVLAGAALLVLHRPRG